MNHPSRGRRHAASLTINLTKDNRVEWAEQQLIRTRVKRDLIEHIDQQHTRSYMTDPLAR